MIRLRSPHGGRTKRGLRLGHEQAGWEEPIELVGAARRKSKSCGKFSNRVDFKSEEFHGFVFFPVLICFEVENQTEVSAEDKKAALEYYDCLIALAHAMATLYGSRWWVERPWKMNPREPRIPLLEGIHALFENCLVFGYGDPVALVDLESAIKRLPTVQKLRRKLNNLL
jgi:hypothetical protein